jgi:hypothetical protein
MSRYGYFKTADGNFCFLAVKNPLANGFCIFRTFGKGDDPPVLIGVFQDGFTSVREAYQAIVDRRTGCPAWDTLPSSIAYQYARAGTWRIRTVYKPLHDDWTEAASAVQVEERPLLSNEKPAIPAVKCLS